MPRPRNAPAALADIDTRLLEDRPKGEQLVERLEQYIAGLRPGVLVPSERVIADTFGVARMTARQAIDVLARRGVVTRHPNRGTFVSEPKFVHTQQLRSFSADMRSRGMTPGARVITANVATATGSVAADLDVEPGTPVLHVERVRTADDIPMAIERTNLSLRRFPGIDEIDFGAVSLYHVLATRWGVEATSAERRIEAILPDAHDAGLLTIDRRQPVFRIEHISRDPMGRVVEAGTSLYRGDRYDVLMHVDLTSNP